MIKVYSKTKESGGITMKNICLGIELGSTRIKAVAIDEKHTPVSSGDYTWASSFENGIWTYLDRTEDGAFGRNLPGRCKSCRNLRHDAWLPGL